MRVMDEQERKFLDHVGTPIFVLEIDGDGEPIYAAFNKCDDERDRVRFQRFVSRYPGDAGPDRPA